MAKVVKPHIAYHGTAPLRRNSVPQSGQHPTERYPLPMLCMLMNTPLDCGRSHSGHRIVCLWTSNWYYPFYIARSQAT